MFEFSDIMKTLRKQRGLTQEQIAETLGVSCQAISKWETGGSFPDISLLPVIADYYGVSIDYLLGHDTGKRMEEIDRVLKDGFTQEELDEAKKGYTDYRAINRSQDGIVASQWIALMKEGRDWTESKENDEKIRRLTLKDVNDAFKKMVDPKRLTIVLAGDQKKANEQ